LGFVRKDGYYLNACLPFVAEAVVHFDLVLISTLYVQILVDPESRVPYQLTEKAFLPDR